MAFREGDPVEFVDKYGILVRGHFYDSQVTDSGVRATVIAQPFGPETGDVTCSVPITALKKQGDSNA